jgi:hypothetical protein
MKTSSRHQQSKTHRRPQASAVKRSSQKSQDGLGKFEMPLSQLTRELRSFGNKRAEKAAEASTRMVTVGNIGDATIIQSHYVLDMIDDYVSEASRLTQMLLQAYSRNLGEVSVAEQRMARLGRNMAAGRFAQAANEVAQPGMILH